MNRSIFVFSILFFYVPILGFSQKLAAEKPRVASKSVSVKKPTAKKKGAMCPLQK
ncbi:MAG: hypothetical protein HC817_02645 [Saprospiraceae bacterium]|nr:hypothetical protein [Saprospiraceae bacterium]